MGRYDLLKFSGDKEVEGKIMSIISWTDKSDKEVLNDIFYLKMLGILHRDIELRDSLNRQVITFDTISGNIIVTIDFTQHKMVLISDSNILLLFNIVEGILSLDYDRDIVYRTKKVFKCLLQTIKSLCKEGYS